MATTPTTSQGVQLKRNGTLIGGIMSISGPNITSAQIDVTSLDDTAKKYIAGLDDGGEVSFEFNWIAGDAQQAGLRTDQQNRTVQTFSLHFNDPVTVQGGNGSKYDFTAIVTAFSHSVGVDNQAKASCTLKISGDLTFTQAT